MSVEQVRGLGAELRELRINPGEPSVIVVFGKVGVGKTTIASEIARRLGTSVLTSDEFRRKRYPGLQYESWHSAAALWDMITTAKQLFNERELSVVLDATFSNKRYRENARRLADKSGKRLIWVEVVSSRPESGSGNIDGQLVFRRTEEPVEIGQRIVVDNSIRSEDRDEQIKYLVDQFMVS